MKKPLQTWDHFECHYFVCPLFAIVIVYDKETIFCKCFVNFSLKHVNTGGDKNKSKTTENLE